VVKIGILGVGKLRRECSRILKENGDIIGGRVAKRIVVEMRVVRDINRDRGVDIRIQQMN